MSLKSRFLTLSIKEQIYISIVLLTLFCILVVFSICCSLSYEFLKADYTQKRLYFFNKYKQYIESCYFFQNFCLLQYEETIKRMQKQAWKYHQSLEIYFNLTNFDNYSEAIMEYNDSRDKDIISDKSENNFPKLFFFCYRQYSDLPDEESIYLNELFYKEVYYYLLDSYQPLSNTIVYHDIYESFRIPGYNVPIIKTPLFNNINFSTLICFNASKIHQKLIEIQNGNSSYIDHNKLNKYFQSKIDEFLYILYYLFDSFIFKDITFFYHMFKDSFNEISEDFIQQINSSNKEEVIYFVKKASGHFASIDYANNKYTLISYGMSEDYIYFENDLMDDYLYFMNQRLSIYLNSNFIPLYYGNNTIITPGLCLLFLFKQYNYKINNETIKKAFEEIKKGNNTFESCFYDTNYINSKIEMSDLFNLNFSFFFQTNNSIYKGITHLVSDEDKYPYYFMKYTYPNYNVLKDFQSEYFLINQVNYYLFASFKEPIDYSEHVYQISQNCFLLIILLILYTWIICLVINLVIYSKVINKWTDPIIKLQKAVESSSIKDENIFKYQYDDIINELFDTCKELLSGQIDNNEQGLKNFNILSIPKDKQKVIDKNIYEKNLIINNDVMNHLLNQHQNTMDYSKNIELNQYNPIDKNHRKKNKLINKDSYSPRLSENNLSSIKEDKLFDKTLNNINIKNKVIEEKENEPYIKLFKISEYINYYRNKVGPKNNILIIDKDNKDNIVKNERKMSKTSQKINKNINSSIKNLKGSFIYKNDLGENNENNGNLYVNMLDEENISYLWYMEEKKKNNKSFNYNISDEYKELFIDPKNNYKYNDYSMTK